MASASSKGGEGSSGSNREQQLAASIPSLRSSSASSSAKPQLSLSARLALARIEDRRRQRNAGELTGSSSGASSSSLGPTVALVDQGGYGGAAAYLSSLDAAPALARERREEQARREARRAVAGPAMPQSWTGAFTAPPNANGDRDLARRTAAAAFEGRALPPHRRGVKGPRAGKAAASGSQAGHEHRRSAVERRRLCKATRHFVDGPTSSQDQPLPSLVDLSLARIASLLQPSEAVDQSDVKEIARCLPVHLVHRLMTLAGREARIPPLTAVSLRVLLFEEDDEEEQSAAAERAASEASSGSADEWDSASEDEAAPALLDLSFVPLTLRMFRSLTSLRSEPNVTLRKLCLAGTTITNLAASLSSMPNLELLSLAGSYPRISTLHRDGTGSSSSPINLRVLARATPRLQVLDLTHCTWIEASAGFEALEWWAAERTRRPAWPELKHLVLRQIPCFSPLHEGRIDVEEEEAEITWYERVGEDGLLPSPAWVNEAHRARFQRSSSDGEGRSRALDRRVIEHIAAHATDAWPAAYTLALSATVRRGLQADSLESYANFASWERERAKVLDALWGRTPSAGPPIEGAGSHSCEVYF